MMKKPQPLSASTVFLIALTAVLLVGTGAAFFKAELSATGHAKAVVASECTTLEVCVRAEKAEQSCTAQVKNIGKKIGSSSCDKFSLREQCISECSRLQRKGQAKPSQTPVPSAVGTSGEVTLPDVSCLIGDMNADQKLTSLDVDMLRALAQQPTTVNNNPCADINDDAVIDSKDTELLTSLLNKGINALLTGVNPTPLESSFTSAEASQPVPSSDSFLVDVFLGSATESCYENEAYTGASCTAKAGAQSPFLKDDRPVANCVFTPTQKTCRFTAQVPLLQGRVPVVYFSNPNTLSQTGWKMDSLVVTSLSIRRDIVLRSRVESGNQVSGDCRTPDCRTYLFGQLPQEEYTFEISITPPSTQIDNACLVGGKSTKVTVPGESTVAICGDSKCDCSSETCFTCAQDCGACAYPGTVGNVACGWKERKFEFLVLKAFGIKHKVRIERYLEKKNGNFDIGASLEVRNLVLDTIYKKPELYDGISLQKYDEAVLALSTKVKQKFRGGGAYALTACPNGESGRSGVASSPSDLLRGGSGNCVDWSALTVSLFRTIGVPPERTYVQCYPSFERTFADGHCVAVYLRDNGGFWIVNFGTVVTGLGDLGALACDGRQFFGNKNYAYYSNDVFSGFGMKNIPCEGVPLSSSPRCGDGLLAFNEECDGGTFGSAGNTCSIVDERLSGQLSCGNDCQFRVNSCTGVPAIKPQIQELKIAGNLVTVKATVPIGAHDPVAVILYELVEGNTPLRLLTLTPSAEMDIEITNEGLASEIAPGKSYTLCLGSRTAVCSDPVVAS